MKQLPYPVSNGYFYGEDDANATYEELENAIKDVGQTLSAGDLHQISQAMARYAGKGTYYICTGAADAYVLTKINSYEAPPVQDGLKIRTTINISNTGASTLNYNSSGAKTIKKLRGTQDLVVGDLVAGDKPEFIYNLSLDLWELNTQPIIGNASTTLPGIIELATQTEVNTGTDTERAIVPVTLRNFAPVQYLRGFKIEQDIGDTAHDIKFNEGIAFGEKGLSTMRRTSPLVKQIDFTWAQGNNVGGRAEGVTLTNDTWYYCFSLGKPDGTTDCIFDTDIDATNALADTAVVAAGYVDYMMVYAFFYTSSSIRAFHTIVTSGGERIFLFNNQFVEINTGTPPITQTLLALHVPPDNIAIIRAGADTAEAVALYDTLIIDAGDRNHYTHALVDILTNSASQIYYYASSGSAAITITTHGYKLV